MLWSLATLVPGATRAEGLDEENECNEFSETSYSTQTAKLFGFQCASRRPGGLGEENECNEFFEPSYATRTLVLVVMAPSKGG